MRCILENHYATAPKAIYVCLETILKSVASGASEPSVSDKNTTNFDSIFMASYLRFITGSGRLSSKFHAAYGSGKMHTSPENDQQSLSEAWLQAISMPYDATSSAYR